MIINCYEIARSFIRRQVRKRGWDLPEADIEEMINELHSEIIDITFSVSDEILNRVFPGSRKENAS